MSVAVYFRTIILAIAGVRAVVVRQMPQHPLGILQSLREVLLRQNLIDGRAVQVSGGQLHRCLTVSVRVDEVQDDVSARQRGHAGCIVLDVTLDYGIDHVERRRGVAGGVAANLIMLKDGMAWHYKQYSDDEILARAEMDARAMKVGLWRDPNPIAPWQFQRSRSAPAPAAPMITPRQPVTAVASPAAREVTVYVTKSGTKYHTGNCRHVASSKIPIDLAGAKARNQPCSVRGPPR